MTGAAGDPASPLPEEEVTEMIGGADPPEAVRAALLSRSVRLVRYEERRSRDFAPGPPAGSVGLDGRISERLEGMGLPRLYAYQAEAIRLILGGQSVVIEAPTAAGKTVAFLAPVLHVISRPGKRGIRAIFVYPTKALGHDQKRKIEEMASAVGVRTMVFDADIDDDEKDRVVRELPEIIVTNFDTLHYQMLNHKHLAGLLRHVEFLVVDEAHSYTGAFGSSVHHVIARLRRFAGSLQCIAASATLRDSAGFCSELFGQYMRVVHVEGRLSTLDFAIMQPLSNREMPDKRIQRHELAVRIAKMMQGRDNKTILFSNSHRNAEMVGVLGAREGLNIRIHRAGLGAKYLRETERQFGAGEIAAISCTPTLELGMDIGGVNTVISEIVPANRFLQRIGRAGRKGERGCAFLILGHDPISQYYRRHPDQFARDEWRPRINPKNPRIEELQTIAMAKDHPLDTAEAAERRPVVERCIDRDLLGRVGNTVRPTDAGDRELWDHNIRGIIDPIRVHMGESRIGERARPAALAELHPGAVYMSRGVSYRITSLNERGSRADAEPMSRDDTRHTTAMVEKRIDDAEPLWACGCLDTGFQYCRLKITVSVAKYAERDYALPSWVRYHDLETPIEYTFETRGIKVWPRRLDGATAGGDAQGWALHAMEHAITEAACMVVGAAHSDLGSASQSGLIYVYDNIEGENGTAKAMSESMGEILTRARDIVAGCGCSEDPRGCVNCTLSHSCGRGNNGLYKAGALELLRGMVGSGARGGSAA